MKVLFVNENIGGHATVHHHLRLALQAVPDVDARFLDVPAPGFLRRVLGASVPGLGRLDLDLQPIRAQLALSAWVARRLDRLADDVDVIHLYTQNAGLLSASTFRRVPTVVSLDTTNARNAYRLPYRSATRFTPLAVPFSKWFERRVFDAADRVIANSEWAAASLHEDYGLDDTKVVVMPLGVTAPEVPTVAPPNRPTIVFLGRQFESKGGAVLLRAWRRSVSDRADLVLVTKDPVAEEPGVRVIGDLDQGDDRLWAILAGATMLAFPSTIDQAPNAVLEAMAAGLPVIAVPTAGVAEMVVDGATGVHVAADDERDLAAALSRLVDNPDECRRMGAAGRARFVDRYDAVRSTAALVAHLRATADRTGVRA